MDTKIPTPRAVLVLVTTIFIIFKYLEKSHFVIRCQLETDRYLCKRVNTALGFIIQNLIANIKLFIISGGERNFLSNN